MFEVGVTINCDPSELGVPAAGCVHNESVNHCHVAPVSSVPPDCLNVSVLPEQTVSAVAVMLVGAIDRLLTVILTESHGESSHKPLVPLT